MLTRYNPKDWKDLQICVGRILKECGFNVEVEKVVETARGKVEIDVYSEEFVKGRKYIILCECKFWQSNVPQSIVHGLRTVVNDLGANIGYIITTSDFQAGAKSANDYSNIELLTWDAFEDIFFPTWYEVFFVPEITNRLDPLLTYCEYILPKWFSKMSEEDKSKFLALKERYDVFGYIMMGFTTYSSTFNHNINSLPISNRPTFTDDLKEHVPEDILNENGYSEFLDKCTVYGMQALSEFRELRDKYFGKEE